MAASSVDGDAPPPRDSLSSVSTTSLVFERLQDEMEKASAASKPALRHGAADDADGDDDDDDDDTASHAGETGPFLAAGALLRKPMDRGLRRVLVVGAAVVAAAWLAALVVFVATGAYRHGSDAAHDPDSGSRGSGKPITLDQVLGGFWAPRSRSITWIADPAGRDGLLLERDAWGKDYLVVEDVRAMADGAGAASGAGAGAGPPAAAAAAASSASSDTPAPPRTLMKTAFFEHNGQRRRAEWVEPSPDLAKVLIGVNKAKNWRYSFTATYFVLDVASGAAEPLVPANAAARVQLATWSPRSDAVAFTMDNNLYLRRLAADAPSPPVQITTDGGPEYFYGIPDWVYEEEVFSGRTATWWSADGRYLAFLRTNETGVREFPVAYYVSRPSGKPPAPGAEAYPEERRIKYPKPGSHNPVVDVQFYDTAAANASISTGAGAPPFGVPVAGGFGADDRIVANVLWAGAGAVLVKQTNRVGDHVQVVRVDVGARAAAIVHDVDVARVDGGWYDVSHTMTFVPADPARGRAHDGYVDTVVHDGFDHLAYFSPVDSREPVMLTSGAWEVDGAPSAVDLANNVVYFVAARPSPVQRHVYAVRLDGAGLAPLTDPARDAYFAASFSAGAGFALLSYQGPGIPWQRVVSTPAAGAPPFNHSVEDNAALAERARRHQLPTVRHGVLDLGDGVNVTYMERRPPHMDPRRRHPVLFHQYSGPGSQTVSRRFAVDFQAYVAAALGYVVVSVDPRGTGFRGRRHRVGVRSRLGQLEARDHIAAARRFAARPYVDAARLAIWGWSYGGFAALKTLEADAGATFAYGVAVAPVTDWRFYDSLYAERYMRLPADNPAGYAAARVANASALGACTRFLLMHGVADDNVHFQNSLALLDALDLAAVENYDVHVFPDSDHSISFHGANRIVYDKINNWLVNAFNGEWLKTANPKPNTERLRRRLAAAAAAAAT